ncbi:DUF2505 domain-containing protein [Quadrisphaera sp. GCM10027208]|uniref:DUF2505 domain-containing protein n=1 Tax=Quadrisphaera sp. GCM10027208 TaxID=3273423 RepID=UPI00360CBAB7
MRVDNEIRYPASPDEVAAMLADEAFQERKLVATHAVSHEIEITGDASGAFTVTTRRTLPTDDVPDVARRFVGPTIDVRQVEAWEAPDADGARTGTVEVQIAGAPVRLSGTLSLVPDGEGTVEVMTGELKASVPLVGGRLEQAAQPAFLAAIRKEQEVGTAWLAGER